MCCKNKGRHSSRNGSAAVYEPRQSFVGMLVRQLIEKREAKRALTQQPYTYDPMPGGRGSSDKDQIYGQGRRVGPAEWVDVKETGAVRQSRESLSVEPPTYGQVMKGV